MAQKHSRYFLLPYFVQLCYMKFEKLTDCIDKDDASSPPPKSHAVMSPLLTGSKEEEESRASDKERGAAGEGGGRERRDTGEQSRAHDASPARPAALSRVAASERGKQAILNCIHPSRRPSPLRKIIPSLGSVQCSAAQWSGDSML